MSRLQSFLRALPPQSTVTKAMFDDQAQVNKEYAQRANVEIDAARSVQMSAGCTWAAAIGQAVTQRRGT